MIRTINKQNQKAEELHNKLLEIIINEKNINRKKIMISKLVREYRAPIIQEALYRLIRHYYQGGIETLAYLKKSSIRGEFLAQDREDELLEMVDSIDDVFKSDKKGGIEREVVELTKDDPSIIPIIYHSLNSINNSIIKAANYSAVQRKGIDEELIDVGITSIMYSNGSKHNFSNYITMVNNTSEHQMFLKGGANERKALGLDLVIVSSHMGACYKCVPYQHKVLIDDINFSTTSDDYNGKYDTLSSAIDNGLFHPNCRHHLIPYIEKYYNYDSLKINKTDQELIEYYEEEQKIKRYLREIRKLKRDLVVHKSNNDKKEIEKTIKKIARRYDKIRNIK